MSRSWARVVRWTPSTTEGGHDRARTVHRSAVGKCLDVYNADGGPQIQMWWCNGWNNRDRLIDSGYHGAVRLRSVSNPSLCVDIYDHGRGTIVQMRDCRDVQGQYWWTAG
ncbi:RICIN domain-containing protein [Saccharothrix saharensis]|uniref:RICIN domain-containing protein n=1 Tax=Saccharothrix saharensis TaxID=571190 RepID=UPI0036A36F62